MDWTIFSYLLPILAVVLLGITSLVLLISNDWRLSLVVLSVQYVGVFVLVLRDWPFAAAAVKLVAGWIGCAIVGMAFTSLAGTEAEVKSGEKREVQKGTAMLAPDNPSGRLVFILAAVLVWITIYIYAPQLPRWLPEVDIFQAVGGLLLIGIGLLKLGFSNHIFSVLLGLFCVISGFEILYAAIESSALVAGLLAGTTLGLALLGAYLLLAQTMEVEV
jgi:hypothetical protein